MPVRVPVGQQSVWSVTESERQMIVAGRWARQRRPRLKLARHAAAGTPLRARDDQLRLQQGRWRRPWRERQRRRQARALRTGRAEARVRSAAGP